MSYVYPSGPLDVPAALASTLGSFWSSLYGGKDTVAAVLEGQSHLALQALVGVGELVDGVGRRTIRPFHRVRWLPIVLKASNRLPGRLPAYGDGTTYGIQALTGAAPVYGGAVDTTVAYAVDAAITAVPALCDCPYDSAVHLTAGVDFRLVGGDLVFLSDPLSDPRMTVRPVYAADGTVVDRQALLWACQADVDRDALWQQFGYVVGLRMPSGEGAKDVLNAAWDGLVGGTARQQIEEVLSAVTGAPLAAGGETVQYVTADSSGRLVITDRAVYRFGAAASVLVSPGAALVAGQQLTNAVTICELGGGAVPPVPALSLGKGFLHPSIAGDLVFVNAPVPVTASVAADGHTVASFPLGGDPADVSAFFSLMDARGLANGTTLARALDVRAVKSGEPAPVNMPATVNPLAFLVANVLRFNTFLAVLNTDAAGPDAAGTNQGYVLRRLMPPGTALLLLVLVTGPGEAITMQGPTYYAETLTGGDATEVWGDTTAGGSFADAPVSAMNV